MEIFDAEIRDGLEDKLKAPVLAYSTLLYPAKQDPEIFKWSNKVIATNLNQPDLYYLNTILATVGWNNNQDVFGKEETWRARHTAEDKRINLHHVEKDIVGHITGNFVIDEKWNVVADDTEDDKVPDKFHIVTNAVVYRHWEDEEMQAKIDEMIGEIEAGEWYVSMECLATGFDYAVINAKGEQTIVKRNKETAHLTKYLRSMGGDGEYKNCKIGRYLRGILFSGKGFTKKPANPDSIILNDATIKSVTSFVTATVHEEFKGDEEMADKPVELTASISLEDHKAETDKLRTELNDLKEKAVAEKTEGFKITLKTKEDELNSVKESLVAANAKIAELDAKVKALAEENTKLSAKASELESEKVALSRVAALVKAGKTEDEAKKLVAEKFSKLDDASFEGVVALVEEAVKASKLAAEKKPEEELPESDTAENRANAAELDKKPEEKPVVVTAEEDKKVGDDLQAYFADMFNKNKKGK
jgi:hypothetical protein